MSALTLAVKARLSPEGVEKWRVEWKKHPKLGFKAPTPLSLDKFIDHFYAKYVQAYSAAGLPVVPIHGFVNGHR